MSKVTEPCCYILLNPVFSTAYKTHIP